MRNKKTEISLQTNAIIASLLHISIWCLILYITGMGFWAQFNLKEYNPEIINDKHSSFAILMFPTEKTVFFSDKSMKNPVSDPDNPKRPIVVFMHEIESGIVGKVINDKKFNYVEYRTLNMLPDSIEKKKIKGGFLNQRWTWEIREINNGIYEVVFDLYHYHYLELFRYVYQTNGEEILKIKMGGINVIGIAKMMVFSFPITLFVYFGLIKYSYITSLLKKNNGILMTGTVNDTKHDSQKS